jgi:hypothetical protein
VQDNACKNTIDVQYTPFHGVLPTFRRFITALNSFLTNYTISRNGTDQQIHSLRVWLKINPRQGLNPYAHSILNEFHSPSRQSVFYQVCHAEMHSLTVSSTGIFHSCAWSDILFKKIMSWQNTVVARARQRFICAPLEF